MNYAYFLSPEAFLAFIVFPFFVGYAGITDILTMRIPNIISAVISISFGLFAWAHETSVIEVVLHYSTGFLVLLVTIGLFAVGWIGGGDAKFLAAISVWFGWLDVLPFIVISAIFGGFLTLLILYFRHSILVPPLWNFLARLHDSKNGVPYGAALSAAALVTFPDTLVWESIFK